MSEFLTSTATVNDLFGVPLKNKRGVDVSVTKIDDAGEHSAFIPVKKDNYTFHADLLKTALFALECNMPGYLHGPMGVGKTSIWLQVCARTGRPVMRVQHTINTEEAHILGQFLIKDDKTVFELGPLPYCMKYGLVYIADEYDFARPSILSLYQPVLEGEPLVIKEADAENRVIYPHPQFRIVATGNTNGTGDESGLYQGTQIQNAANYERWAVMEYVSYPEKENEAQIIQQEAMVDKSTAEKLVDFASYVRADCSRGKVSIPVSPRSLIHAAKIGLRLGSLRRGLELAYVNRLTPVDWEAVNGLIDRMEF